MYLFVCIIVLLIVLIIFLYRNLKKKIVLLSFENKKHKKMLNVTLEAVIFIKNQKIVDLNEAAIELAGFEKKEEVIGLSFHNFVFKEDLEMVKQNVQKRFIGKYEVTLIDKNNKKFPALLQVNRFEEEDKDTTIVNILDLTDIKRREYILSQNVKMAQMGEMIGNIAHQWRQPLSVITTAASGIKMKKEYAKISDEELYSLLDSIVLNSEHLSSTIDIFRNFIKEKVELKEVIIQDRINNALAIIETRINNEHITLINKIDYTAPIKAIIIVGELSQVIINIINNAIDILIKKNNPKKTIELDLEKEDDKILITIEDNGGGISADTMSHIFEPYFTTKHKSVGTGIGLYMSYDIIVNHMKGKLYAKNSEQGAKFIIELPIEKRLEERRTHSDNKKKEHRVTQRRVN
jgi:two-component system sensor histidine kinase EvgS